MINQKDVKSAIYRMQDFICDVYDEDREVLFIAIDCIRLQLAKKPIESTLYKGWWFCPSCKNILLGRHPHCSECSQKIDWKEVEK